MSDSLGFEIRCQKTICSQWPSLKSDCEQFTPIPLYLRAKGAICSISLNKNERFAQKTK